MAEDSKPDGAGTPKPAGGTNVPPPGYIFALVPAPAAPPTPPPAQTEKKESPPTPKDEAMVPPRLLYLILVPIALWDVYTTYLGVSYFFDLPTNPDINPGQFVFGLVVTLIVFLFVVTTQFIHSLPAHGGPILILKGAWATAVAIDLYTAWDGTRRIVFYGEEDAAKGVGVAIVAALIVTSTIFLSQLLLGRKAKA